MTRRLYECPGCGAELLNAARACPNCGEAIVAIPSRFMDEVVPSKPLTDAGVMREVRAVLMAEQAKREETL